MMHTDTTIGLIGGTGPSYFSGAEAIQDKTFVSPLTGRTINYQTGLVGGKKVVCLPRHGIDHNMDPRNISPVDNMLVMYTEYVDIIIGISATGVMDLERVNVGDIVFPDHVYKVNVQQPTLFGKETVVHRPTQLICEHVLGQVENMADDINETLRSQGLEARIHTRGISVSVDGPNFSDPAESAGYRSTLHKPSNIGMTIIEAYARTTCYINLAHGTDADNPPEGWEEHERVDQEMVSEQAAVNKDAIEIVVPYLIDNLQADRNCSCRKMSPNDVLGVTHRAPEIVLRVLRDMGGITSHKYTDLMNQKGVLGRALPPIVNKLRAGYESHIRWRLGL